MVALIVGIVAVVWLVFVELRFYFIGRCLDAHNKSLAEIAENLNPLDMGE